MNKTFALNHEGCNIPTTSFQIHKLIMQKKCPSTYHIIIYHLEFDVNIHLDIIHKWGCWIFVGGMFCFLPLFLFSPLPHHGGGTLHEILKERG